MLSKGSDLFEKSHLVFSSYTEDDQGSRTDVIYSLSSTDGKMFDTLHKYGASRDTLEAP